MKHFDNTLTLQSHISELYKLENFIDNISEELNIGHTYFSNIITVLSELVENAIVHGNKNQLEKSITIEFENSHGQLIFTVSDQGEGFYINEKELDIEFQQEGRGIGLILAKTLSDKIEFLNNGKSVKVMFDLASANKLLSLTRINIFKGLKSEPKKISK